MEGNKDEATRCLYIAKKALLAGDRDKATRFLNKADKLYPSAEARGKWGPLLSVNDMEVLYTDS